MRWAFLGNMHKISWKSHPKMKKCKYNLLVMDGNVSLSSGEEELNIQRSQQREKEVLVLGCLVTGYLPKNHHPS